MGNDSHINMIFVTFGPISSFHYHTTYWADYLTQKKIDFKIYDCTPLMAKYNFATPVVPDPLNDIELANIETIKSYSYFESLLKELDKEKTLIIVHPRYEYLTYRIYRLISEHKLRYCVYNMTGWPSINESTLDSHMKLCYKLTLKNLIAAISTCKSKKDILRVGADLFTHIPRKLLGINSANYVLISGTDSLNWNFNFPISKKTKYILGHCRDYDQYLKSIENPINVKEKQIAYISANLFHDVYLTKDPAYVKIMRPELYYKSLKKLFHILEKKGYTIIVAAHPRESLSELKQHLNEWEVILGDTNNLIRESKYSIQLASASTAMSLLHERPFIMITSDSIIDTKERYYGMLVAYSNSFGKKLLNIDHLTDDIELDEYLTADQILVEKYISSRLKVPGSPKLPLCQILLNNIW